MAVYSCIQYLYEIPLVKIRLAEESNHVDFVHVVEGNVTFTGQAKPSCFTKFPEDLAQDKRIIYRHLDLASVQMTSQDRSLAWARERVSRATLPEGLEPHDILLISDCDEIHRAQDLGHILDMAKRFGFVKIPCHNHYYKVNFVHRNPTLMDAPFAVTVGFLDKTGLSIQELRRHLDPRVPRVRGIHSHHFDYLASPELISEKLRAFAHEEYSGPNWTDPNRITRCIERGLDLFEREPGPIWIREDLTDTYPRSILDSRDQYPDWFA